MRILLDTNIIVSGLISPNGVAAELIDAWDREDFVLVTSIYQFEEIRRVFGYQHLKSRVSPAELVDFLDRIAEKAFFAENLPEVNLSPDPKDNPILATAIAGKVEFIVTGDKRDILALRSVHAMPVITARELLKRLGLN